MSRNLFDCVSFQDRIGRDHMRFARMVAGSTALITAALGLSVATAGPASAAAYGSWHHYGNTNPITSSSSTWRCGSSTNLSSVSVGQICAIRSSSGTSAQAALIIRNNATYTIWHGGGWFKLRNLSGTTAGEWDCASPEEGIAPKSWSVCFGETLSPKLEMVRTRGGVGGLTLEASPYV